jgi:hypothetical protein
LNVALDKFLGRTDAARYLRYVSDRIDGQAY